MSRTNALDTLNAMIIYQTKGLPYRSRLRIAVLSRLSGNDIKSSLEIPPATVSELLEIYFPNWQVADSYPPEDNQNVIRSIAEQCSAHFESELGDYQDYIARIEAEHEARRAAKEAAKFERIRLHEEREKKKRESKKKAVVSVPPPSLPTTRQRRIFG